MRAIRSRPVLPVVLACLGLVLAGGPAVLAQSEGDPGGVGGQESGTAYAWTRTEKPTGIGVGGRLWAAAALPGGEMVLVGSGPCCKGQPKVDRVADAAMAWHSADGLTWEPTPLPGATRDGLVSDVAAWEGGFVAVGTRHAKSRDDGLVWTSATGSEWSDPVRVKDAVFMDVLVTGDGLAVVGAIRHEDYSEHATMWTSPDALTWQQAPIGAATKGFSAVRLRAARSPEGVWLVLGYESGTFGFPLWRSADGIAWTDARLPSFDPKRDFAQWIEWTPSGFVLAINTGTEEAVERAGTLWHSTDGLVWTQVATSPEFVLSVASGAAGSFAFTWAGVEGSGFAEAAPIVGTSTDGMSWVEAENPAFEGALVQGATFLPDGRGLAVGMESGSNILGGKPIVWLGAPAQPGG